MQYNVIEQGNLENSDVYLFFKDSDKPSHTYLITSIGGEITLTGFDETGHVDCDLEEEHIELLESHFDGLQVLV